MRRTWLLILLLVPLAAAQPGPAPGYGNAIEYGLDYADASAQDASGDPEGFAASKGSPQGAQAEANHTAYMACWAADDLEVESAACDPFYTPRGEAQPPAEPCECNVSAEPPINATLNETDAFLNATANATEQFLVDKDPVGFVGRIAEGAEKFVTAVVGGIAMAGLAVVGAILFCLGLAGVGIQAAGSGIAALGQGALGLVTDLGGLGKQGVQAGSEGLIAGLVLAADGIVWTVTGAVAGIAHGASVAWAGIAGAAVAIGHGIATGASAFGEAVASGAKAVGSGIASGASAVGGAIADAASSIKDAVSDLFSGSSDDGATQAPDLDPGLDISTDEGLTDGLLDVLE